MWTSKKCPRKGNWHDYKIDKKGDQIICKNCGSIVLANNEHKILSTIIHTKFHIVTKHIIGEYQWGFVQGKFMVDAIHIVK